MRYAIFSDIHANAQAWPRIEADADEFDAEVFVCLGDVVGYGPKPQAVLDAIRGRTENFVLGNHDAAVTGALDASIFNDQARAVVEWTQTQLDDDAIAFLSEVPLSMEAEDILFVHAEVAEPGRFHYIEDVQSAAEHLAACEHTLVFVGHTHHPTVFVQRQDGIVMQLEDQDFQLAPGNRYLVNVGSAGEPRNPDDIRARYVIYDSETRSVYFRRLEFDVEAYRRDLKRSGLTIYPYFLRIVDHQESAATLAESHAIVREMRIPLIPASGSDTRRRVVVSSGAAPIPKPRARAQGADTPAKRGLKALLLSLLGLLVLAGLSIWLFQKFKGDGPIGVAAPSISIVNGSFEEPVVAAIVKDVPESWDGLTKGTVEMALRTQPAFTKFTAGEGLQAVTLLPKGAICQGFGWGSLNPSTAYSFQLVQYEATDIQDRGGGLQVELWEGYPDSGRLLASQAYPATGAGRSVTRTATLRTPPDAKAGGRLYLCLRQIPDPAAKHDGPVTVDDVVNLFED